MKGGRSLSTWRYLQQVLKPIKIILGPRSALVSIKCILFSVLKPSARALYVYSSSTCMPSSSPSPASSPTLLIQSLTSSPS